MAGEVSKQDQALSRAAEMVFSARQDLDSQIKTLNGKLEQIGGQWTGVGATAFRQVMMSWDQNAKKVISALDGFQENLKRSESTYTAEDEAQQQVFSKLSSRLGN